ncbi:MAG TPA: XRE family transcriptional regulator [Pseudonocardia sp.]|jgi:transcriptional regulator with XRE-family HTH domain
MPLISRSLRRERERVGLSLSELARRAGLAKSTLSQLEAGEGNPSVETLWALAVALEVPFGRIVDPGPSRPVRVIRAGGAAAIGSEHARFTGSLLASCPPGARRDLHLITIEPGTPREADAHSPGTVEHQIAIAGKILTGPVGEQIELEAGDYACYPADVPHSYTALLPGSAAVLVMEYV